VFYVQLILAGIATGAIYSLAGLGVVLTYKGTGVFNFAHGAVAMVVAYGFWEMRTGWHWPLIIAVPLALLFGAAIGLLLERLVFRPLLRSGAGLSEKLVATLGVFTLLIGFAYYVWTGKVRQGPRIVTNRPLDLTHGLRIGTDQLAIVGVVVLVSILVWFLFRRTHLGTEIRAVVDRRELAELTAVNANRVAGISWALGCAFAGLTGMLLPTNGLDPAGLTLLVIETFSIAVVARLTSLPIAVAAGILLLGVAQSLLTNVHLFGGRGVIGTSIEQIKPNLSVLILFAALLIYRHLEVVGEDERPPALRGSRFRLSDYPTASVLVYAMVTVGFVVLPMFLSFTTFPYGQRMLALAIIFVSIVIITGFAGYITLGQGAFAGFGGFLSARMVNSLHVPVVLAMVIGALGAMVLGFLAGYPALRRKGLFLGLTTLGVALFAYSFIFQSTVFSGGSNGLSVRRPSLFGVSLAGAHAFYYFELACLGLMLLLARNVRSGRLGRILSAMRDSETAAASIGIDTRRFKLFVFSLSAFVAGMGGALLVQGSRVFEPLQFNPLVSSLVWFTVVIVAGVDTLSGALLGAALFVLLDAFLKTAGLSQLLIGVAALSLGRLPGGSLLGTLRALADRFVSLGQRAVAQAMRQQERDDAERRPAVVATPVSPYVATDFARRLVSGAVE
jgi:branched-chain amino acid transport system permease protein